MPNQETENLIQFILKQQAEFQKNQAELQKQQAEYQAEFRKGQAELQKQQVQFEKQQALFQKEIVELQRQQATLNTNLGNKMEFLMEHQAKHQTDIQALISSNTNLNNKMEFLMEHQAEHQANIQALTSAVATLAIQADQDRAEIRSAISTLANGLNSTNKRVSKLENSKQ